MSLRDAEAPLWCQVSGCVGVATEPGGVCFRHAGRSLPPPPRPPRARAFNDSARGPAKAARARQAEARRRGSRRSAGTAHPRRRP